MIDFKNVSKDQKIVVALSGGVDSSTTIALLKENGYKNIVAMTLILHDKDQVTGIASKDQKIVADCEKVSKDLDVEHRFIDIKEDFKERIIMPFFEGSLKGITFNPCIKCNREIKFGLLYEEAKKIGADILVTGHYIKWDLGPDGLGAIYRPLSEIRDQSYFLSQVKKETLKHIRFPLANMNKEQVRNEAKRLGVHVAQKKSSSDLCFTGLYSHNEIINKLYNPQKGKIVDYKGEVVGEHEGIHNFTVGQRKGIGIGGFEEAYYVIEIDSTNNQVVVGPKEKLSKLSVTLSQTNWLGRTDEKVVNKKVFAKIRASQMLIEANLTIKDEGVAEIIFTSPVFGLSKGQICAFYQEDGMLLGGGYI